MVHVRQPQGTLKSLHGLPAPRRPNRTTGEKLSLNYEWNLGLSWGWKPHSDENWYNVGMGSRLNAYINAGMGILWRLSERTEL